MKKKKNLTKVLFASTAAILVIAILLSAFLIKDYIDTYGEGAVVKTKYTTDIYEIASNPNDYQISIYEELAKKCNEYETFSESGGMEDVAGLVVKSFIADFFTWSNKKGSYDIGGLDYVYGPQFINIQEQFRAYYYNNLDLLINQYGSENLPTVTNITITSSNHTKDLFYFDANEYDEATDEYVINQVSYDAYHVIATWEYEADENSTYDTSNLPNQGQFMVINHDGRLEIAYYHEYYY